MIEPTAAAGNLDPAIEVGPQIRNLANLVQLRASNGGKKFVLLLGAGASISSGVTPTQQLMRELVNQYGGETAGTLEERFDTLWRRTSPEDRRGFLEPYLNRRPSSGYQKLAALIQRGFFDLAVTFNYDNLLEKALLDINILPKVVIRGETGVDEIVKLIEDPVPGFTLLKLHGSLTSTDTFLFDQSEMWSYPPVIHSLVERLTSRDLIVCGYAFNDLCVQRAFSGNGGYLVWVNPGGPPLKIRPALLNRHSEGMAIRDEQGKFDEFAAGLATALLAPQKRNGTKPVLIPFKFLAAFDASDKDWFVGRRRLRKLFLSRLTKEQRTVLHVYGAPRSGKTSFVRAGMMAHLDSTAYEAIYLRCRLDLEKQVIDLVARRRPQAGAPPTLQAALTALAADGTAAGKPLVLFLDQFEKVTSGIRDTDAGWDWLLSLFNTLCASAGPALRLVFVTASDEKYLLLVVQSNLPGELKGIDRREMIKPLSTPMIGTMLRFLIKKSKLSFDPKLVKKLLGKLGNGSEGALPFTLAHLQTICHLLVYNSCTTLDHYELQTSRYDLERVLDQAITDCDIMNFLEDFPTRSEQRLVRSFMRAVPESGKLAIAQLIKERFADLMRDVEFPESLA